jgi:hypothetical protein
MGVGHALLERAPEPEWELEPVVPFAFRLFGEPVRVGEPAARGYDPVRQVSVSPGGEGAAADPPPATCSKPGPPGYGGPVAELELWDVTQLVPAPW